jgi:hypothetical protein
MALLFSNSEYIGVVLSVVNRAGVLLEPREFPCDFFLWGYMKDYLLYFVNHLYNGFVID